jgi:hypothetical protein
MHRIDDAIQVYAYNGFNTFYAIQFYTVLIEIVRILCNGYADYT